jgi:ribosomal protein S21
MPKKGTTVILRDGDDVNKALRKLKNKVEEGGALKALQNKEHY